MKRAVIIGLLITLCIVVLCRGFFKPEAKYKYAHDWETQEILDDPKVNDFIKTIARGC